MPRKIIRRWMPDPHKIANHKGLRWLGSLIDSPNLFHLNRQSVSLALFVGFFVAFIPVPFQMLLAALLALWWQCNLPISVVLVWITNPFTIPPMFYGAYLIGTLILGIEPVQFTLEIDLDWLLEEGKLIWKPLLIGSAACGLALGSIGYVLGQVFWRWWVLHNWHKRQQRRKQKPEK